MRSFPCTPLLEPSLKIRNLLSAFALLLTLLVALPAQAVVAPAPIFGSGMVLQREMPVPVWGTAAPDEAVTVSFDGQTLTAKADAKGKWKIALAPMKANAQSRELTIAGPGNTVTLKDVLVGEVWLCSGQSNMTWEMRSVANSKDEVAAANHPTLRFFTTGYASGSDRGLTIKPELPAKLYALHPQETCLGAWQVCSPKTASSCSAVAYYFGRDLQQKINVPVGLVISTMGATAIEAWVSVDGLKAIPSYRERALAFEEIANAYENAPLPPPPGNTPEAIKKAREEALQKALDAQKASVAERSKAWFAQLDAEDVGLKGNWMAPSHDVSKWGTVNLPVTMDNNPIGSPVGTLWFHKDVTIPAEWVGKDLTLSLGVIDAVDEAFVNGTKVGRTWFDAPSYWEAKRVYTVPAAAVTSPTVSVSLRLTKLLYHMAPLGPADLMTLTVKDGEKSAAVSLAGDWRFQKAQDLQPGLQPRVTPSLTPQPNNYYGNPAAMYNGLIAPIKGYAIRGAIWYQGEANAPFYADYRTLFPGLITSWRKEWGQGDFPFGFVQLADYWEQQKTPVERTGYTPLREAQTYALKLPNTFMATAVGYGEGDDIHPKRKAPVGRQLAYGALNTVYGFKDLLPSGPAYKSMAIEGSTIRITFDHARGIRSSTNPLVGFSIAGEDRTFYFAQAKIDGDTVVVSSPKVPKPVAVRYAWATNPVCNLVNAESFPAFPFKTDTWDLAQLVIPKDDKVVIPEGWQPKMKPK
jgi:sialate O-acetylesterase